IMVAAGAFIWWMARGLGLRTMALLALALAGCIFLNTETGLEACVAVAVTAFAVEPNWRKVLQRGALLAALTFAIFMLFSVIAFGPGVLTTAYLVALIEPLALYQSGLGAWPIQWLHGWHFIYNIVAPGLALASIGWSVVTVRRNEN